MKTEHRKELRENSLVRWLSHVKQRMKGGPSRKTVVWVSILVAALVGYLIYDYVRTTAKEKSSEGARDAFVRQGIDNVQMTTGLNELIQKFPEHVLVPEWKLAIARLALEEGLGSGLYSKAVVHRQKARKKLEEAAAGFQELSKQLEDRPEMIQACLFNRALALEGLGKLQEANDQYQDLINRFSDGEVAKEARKRQQYNKDNEPDLTKLHQMIQAGQVPAGG